LVPAAAVGAVGVPVSAGDASGAFPASDAAIALSSSPHIIHAEEAAFTTVKYRPNPVTLNDDADPDGV